ncbi:MAG: hypothetical protein EA421_12905 [Gemmatimonadales bacterium]|nr:MAG: hypothetical protein EA421_12905 [Gemmatimonadales bacterium]
MAGSWDREGDGGDAYPPGGSPRVVLDGPTVLGIQVRNPHPPAPPSEPAHPPDHSPEPPCPPARPALRAPGLAGEGALFFPTPGSAPVRAAAPATPELEEAFRRTDFREAVTRRHSESYVEGSQRPRGLPAAPTRRE